MLRRALGVQLVLLDEFVHYSEVLPTWLRSLPTPPPDLDVRGQILPMSKAVSGQFQLAVAFPCLMHPQLFDGDVDVVRYAWLSTAFLGKRVEVVDGLGLGVRVVV